MNDATTVSGAIGLSRRQFVVAGAALAAMAGLTGTRALAADGEVAVPTSSLADGRAASSAGSDSALDFAKLDGRTDEDKNRGLAFPFTLTQWDGDGNEFTQTYEAAPSAVCAFSGSSANELVDLGLGDRLVGVMQGRYDADKLQPYLDGIGTFDTNSTQSAEAVVATGADLVIGPQRVFYASKNTGAQSYNDLGLHIYSQITQAPQGKGNPTLGGIIEDYENVAAIAGASDAAEDVVADLERRLVAIRDLVEDKFDASHQQGVLMMTSLKDGTFVTFGAAHGAALQFNFLEAAGARMVETEAKQNLTYENLVKYNPDLIIYITITDAAEGEATQTLLGEPTLASVPAIQGKRIVEVDYNSWMDPSPSTFDAAEKVLAALYPQA